MRESIFIEYVDTHFTPIVDRIVERINGQDEKELTYLHKEMLREKYTPTLKWGSISSSGRAVAADVISMDSSLPLKKRPSIESSQGDVPKIGMMLRLGEKDMTDLHILEQTNADGSRTKSIIQTVFADTKRCIVGVYEQLEGMFLEALSTGVTLVDEDTNTGTGIRVDFKHPDKNKFGVQAPWGDENATPIDDIENVLDQAELDGVTIRFLYMDRATFKNFRNADQVKQTYAASIGFYGADIPSPNITQINDALEEEMGVEIRIINRSISYEKNGKTISKKPFAANTVVFLESLDVGTLTYGTLAEKIHPAKQVTYQDADSFILVSKYHEVNPIREFTSSQALVLPVIDNIDKIYYINTDDGVTGVTDSQTEGDDIFDYKGKQYTKDSVIAALNLAKPGTGAKSNWKDSTLLNRINELSVEEILIFEENITEFTEEG